DEYRDRLNDRAEDAAVRIGVVEIVAEPRELPIGERTRVDLVAESARGWDGHGDRDGRACRGTPAARSTDGNRAAERLLTFFERERRGKEVFGLHANPFERAVEQGALIGTQFGEIGPLGLRGFRYDGVMAVIVERIFFGGAQTVRQPNQQHSAAAAQTRDV